MLMKIKAKYALARVVSFANSRKVTSNLISVSNIVISLTKTPIAPTTIPIRMIKNHFHAVVLRVEVHQYPMSW